MAKQENKSKNTDDKSDGSGGYKHVTHDQLLTMGALLAQGKSTRFVAEKVGVSAATVSNRREEAVELYDVDGAEVTQKALRRSWSIIKAADNQTSSKLKEADAKKASDIAAKHIERVQLLSDNPTEIMNANVEVENERLSLAEKAFSKIFNSGEEEDNEETG